jgi:hypothetical protein
MTGVIVLFICLLCIYLVVGYIFALLAEVDDDITTTIIITLFWPFVWTFLIICYIVFVILGTRILSKRK